ncbi:uridine kinase [Arthrobacter antioxidans]|uniref:uridine kinase n=1 Tax=Arthrobacter antioxidans TaxID=2895818 RepID=UPI00200001CD|nr:uridine kinase [Arthrobacter antioxidans]
MGEFIHADHFLNPSPIRYAKGRHSPEGFWADTYDYAALCEKVLGPLGRGGNGWYSPACHDSAADRASPAGFLHAPADALVLVEGMCLHRDELITHGDASVFLDVPFTETAVRMAIRNGRDPDPEHSSMRRYVGGQRRYFEAVRPWERATVVVDNRDFTAPRIIPSDAVSALR